MTKYANKSTLSILSKLLQFFSFSITTANMAARIVEPKLTESACHALFATCLTALEERKERSLYFKT